MNGTKITNENRSELLKKLTTDVCKVLDSSFSKSVELPDMSDVDFTDHNAALNTVMERMKSYRQKVKDECGWEAFTQAARILRYYVYEYFTIMYPMDNQNEVNIVFQKYMLSDLMEQELDPLGNPM